MADSPANEPQQATASEEPTRESLRASLQEREQELAQARQRIAELEARMGEQALQIAALQSQIVRRPRAEPGAEQPTTEPEAATKTDEAPKPAAPRRWEYRFALPVRTAHWINVLALLCMVMSGLQIFNSHSALYLSDDADARHRVMAIDAAEVGGRQIGYLELWGHRIETTGVLGLIKEPDGTMQAQAFPGWMMLGGWLGGARRWHFFFLWVFILNGLIYTLYKFGSGDARRMLFRPRDIKDVWPMVRHYLRLDRQHPRVGKYNALQKQAYSGVWLILAPLIIISGLALSPSIDAAIPFLVPLLGGRQFARTIHFVAMSLFVAFVLVHLIMVITTGLIKNLRAMTTGWYTLADHELPQPEEPAAPAEAVT